MSIDRDRVGQAIHDCEEWSCFWSLDDAKLLADAAIDAVLEGLMEPPETVLDFVPHFPGPPTRTGVKSMLRAYIDAERERLHNERS